MAELKYWEFSDEQLSKAITFCQEQFMTAESSEDVKEWRDICLPLLQEQRHRQEIMLQDETEAAKLSQEAMEFNKKHSLDEKKSKWEIVLGILGVVTSLATAGSTIYSAKKNFESKHEENETTKYVCDRMCAMDELGEIPNLTVTKFRKPK